MINYLIALVLLLGLGYGGVEAWPLLAGPALTVTSPANYAVVPGGILQVTGETSRVARLALDGLPVLHDQSGNFTSILTFPPGSSILTFEASDRFGKSVTVTRNVFVP